MKKIIFSLILLGFPHYLNAETSDKMTFILDCQAEPDQCLSIISYLSSTLMREQTNLRKCEKNTILLIRKIRKQKIIIRKLKRRINLYA